MISQVVILACHYLISFLFVAMQSYAVVHPSVRASYTHVPASLRLQKVVVIHRHGDRAQIAKFLGSQSPISDEVAAKWKLTLPSERSCRGMMLAAQPDTLLLAPDSSIDIHNTLYSGWDKINYPYAQLTEEGSHQMTCVGRELRARYAPQLFSSSLTEGTESIYCRSTSMCRTGQSLRSLLVGMFGINPDHHSTSITPADLANQPKIIIRSFDRETLYPNDGAPAMAHRRNVIFPPRLGEKTFPYYAALEARLKETLGIEEHVNWQRVMEVLHCHRTHGIKYIEGISDEDNERIAEISAWHWGVLYKDAILNKLAIGRFIYDLLADIKSAVGTAGAAIVTSSNIQSTCIIEQECARNKNVLVYSGHDSTLVPVLCALGLYDDTWPPYASHLVLEFACSVADPSLQYVRAVYNNQEMRMFAGLAPAWCPLELFWTKMAEVACSPEEFAAECLRVEKAARVPEESSDDATSEADMTAKEVEEEVAASLWAGRLT